MVLRRRNYLFSGSDAGGECVASFYSLIGTALPNGGDLYVYLRHVGERIAEHPIYNPLRMEIFSSRVGDANSSRMVARQLLKRPLTCLTFSVS